MELREIQDTLEFKEIADSSQPSVLASAFPHLSFKQIYCVCSSNAWNRHIGRVCGKEQWWKGKTTVHLLQYFSVFFPLFLQNSQRHFLTVSLHTEGFILQG